ncbi:MAG TPA: GcrA family cell cycle regulator [Pseudolabrys sp.]|nr:GcrA family cell cycle regulator [Pseudolabrys sp.]
MISHWSDDTIGYLRECWDAGWSAAKCAKAINDKFGMRFSRNAIIGKAHRLGLAKRKQSTRQAAAPKPVRQSAPAFKQRGKLVLLRPAADDDAADAPNGGVTCAELLPHHCRWPLGDPKLPSFRYCGSPAIEPYPYCARHVRVAYRIMTEESAA